MDKLDIGGDMVLGPGDSRLEERPPEEARENFHEEKEEETGGDVESPPEATTSEEPGEAPAESPPPATSEEPGRLYAGRFQSPEDLERSWLEARGFIARQGQELSELRQQMQQVIGQRQQQTAEDFSAQLERRAEELGVPAEYLPGIERLVGERVSQVQAQHEDHVLGQEVARFVTSIPDFEQDLPAVQAWCAAHPSAFNVPDKYTLQQKAFHHGAILEQAFEVQRARRYAQQVQAARQAEAQAAQGREAKLQEQRKAASGEVSRSPAAAPSRPSSKSDRDQDDYGFPTTSVADILLSVMRQRR